MRPYALRVNGRAAPTELDNVAPTFSWRLGSAAKGINPVAFEVRVQRLSPDDEPQRVWSSGEIRSDETSVSFGGASLEPRSRYRWSVAITDGSGITEAAEGEFATGLHGDWSAKWITRPTLPRMTDAGEPVAQRSRTPFYRSWQTMYAAAPLQLRREFALPADPLRATLYATARGNYRAFVNGVRVGRDELTPGWTRYESRLEYQAYDVTEALAEGVNVLAAQVADGWWCGNLGYNIRSHADQYGDRPEFLAQLEIEFADGRRMIVVTDEAWFELPGEIVMADNLMGEYHDSAVATQGWLLPDFDASGWQAVAVTGDDTTMLVGQLAEPVRIVDELEPVSISVAPSGGTIVDFGQNISGRVRMQVRAPRGTVIELYHGEMLDDSELYTANLRSAEARDVVVASGDPSHVFEPAFTFHGFRYLEVRGLVEPLAADDVRAVVLSSDLERTGSFESGSALTNRLMSNIEWGRTDNFVSVATDCPQRDERLGWTADAQIFAPTANFLTDTRAFFDRWLLDLADSQDPSGRVPDIVPLPPTSPFVTAAPGWGDAAVIIPWTQYEFYGDLGLLDRQFDSMRAWVDYIARENPDGLWTRAMGNNYGDWLSVDEHTPHALIAGAYRVRSTDLLARAAAALGRGELADFYAAAAQQQRELFARTFVTEDKRIRGDTQTGYVLSLAWSLVPDSLRDGFAARLIEKIEGRGNRLTTGFLGVRLLCPTLTELGRPDLAIALLLQEEYPSWGYTIRHGATTIWERWDGYTDHRGFQTVEMNSFNHYSMGSVGEWLYRHVAGIDQTPNSVGFRELRIAPIFAEELGFVRASFESVRGRIAVEWSITGGEGQLVVEVPPGSVAEIVLPTRTARVGSGRHDFRFSPAEPAAYRRA